MRFQMCNQAKAVLLNDRLEFIYIYIYIFRFSCQLLDVTVNKLKEEMSPPSEQEEYRQERCDRNVTERKHVVLLTILTPYHIFSD